MRIHTIEGVERHWKLSSVKLRLEAITGVPPHRQVSHNTYTAQTPIKNSARIACEFNFGFYDFFYGVLLPTDPVAADVGRRRCLSAGR